jgi:hypothetical protein
MRINILYPLLLLSVNAFGQSFYLTGTCGYGTYRMTELKNLNNEFIESYVVPLATIDDFPGRIFFDFRIARPVNDNMDIGLIYQYHSTGSRMGYKDYSGSTYVDQIVQSNLIGIGFRYSLYCKNRLELYFDPDLFLALSKVGLINSIQIDSLELVDNLELSSESIVAQLNFIVSYTILDHVFLAMHLGCSGDIGGALHLADNVKAYLQDSDGHKIHTNLTGLRTGLTLGFRF